MVWANPPAAAAVVMDAQRGSWGHAIRPATLDERHDAGGPGWIARTCGRTCGEPIAYRISYRVTGADARPRMFQRFMCPTHARRFAHRWELALPSPTGATPEQQLLPFGGA